jgi:hypothetical protein
MSTETPETTWKGPWSYTGTREDAEKLAIARQRMASESPLTICPRWDELTEHEREMSVLEAANWLTAMRQAGMLPAEAVRPASMEQLVAAPATCEHAALRPRCGRDFNGRCVMCCAHYHFVSED